MPRRKPIDRLAVAAFLNGELAEAEASAVRSAINRDPEVRRWAEELDGLEGFGGFLEDALALADFARDPNADETLERLRALTAVTENSGAATAADADAQPAAGQVQPEPPPEPPAPRETGRERLGDYELLEILSDGGLSTVYRARNVHLDRDFAVKVIAAHRAGCRQTRLRFQREVAFNGRLRHPHLAPAVSAGEDAGRPYLVMELLDGQDVGRIARRWRRLPVAEACEIIRQAAIGAQFLADQGFVHRDLKPSNLMLTPARQAGADNGRDEDAPAGLVKIIDLGLACEASRSGEPAADEITATDQVVGTIDYLAPEQAVDPRRIDGRADIYALGCSLYRLLAGQAPFERPGVDSAAAKLLGHLHRRPVPLRLVRSEVPAALAAIVDRAMAKKPVQRFRDARSLAEALAPFSAGADLGRLLRAEPDTGSESPPGIPAATRHPAAAVRLGLLLLMGFAAALGITIWLRSNGAELGIAAPKGNLQIRSPGVPATKLSAPFSAEQAALGQAAWAKRLHVSVELKNSVGLTLRLIPPGHFSARSAAGELRSERPFFISACEVTEAEFQRVLGRPPAAMESSSPPRASADGGQFPARGVSWPEAIDFCRRLSDGLAERQAGRRYCLPTLDEWAWACRAGNEAELPWPPARARDHAVLHEPAARPVATFAPNPFGLLDVHGNLAEWAAEWMVLDADLQMPPKIHLAPVLCGGSFESPQAALISATARRAHDFQHQPPGDAGFRVVCRLEAAAAAVAEPVPTPGHGFDAMIVRDRSLRGWGFPGGHVQNADGMLEQGIGDGSECGTIWYGRHGNLHDFDLRFDFRIEGDEAESQILFRANVLETGWQQGSSYRFFLAGPKAGQLWQFEPRRYGVVAVTPAEQLVRTRSDTWNRLVLRCAGRRTRIWLNAEPAIDFTDPVPGVCLFGPLSFLTTGPPAAPRRLARFRDLRIQLLGHPPPDALQPMPWTMGADALPANTPPDGQIP